MNIKNIIYSIITGIIIFSTPVHALEPEEATSFFSKIFSLGYSSIKISGPTAIVLGGAYGAYWCYSKYKENKNLHLPNIEQTKEILNQHNQMKDKVNNIEQSSNDQSNIINSVDQQNSENEKLVNQLSPAVNKLALAPLKEKAEEIHQKQLTIKNTLEQTLTSSQENNIKLGAISGVIAAMSQENEKKHLLQHGHLKNLIHDSSEISNDAEQASKNFGSANNNLDEANDDIKKEPYLFKQQLKQNEQKKQSQKLENCRQNHILNVTPLTQIKVN